MSNTINNGIPLVPENTIDPAAGLNLALNTIDALLQVLVQTVGANTPPTGVEGNRYIVGTSPTGAWSGQANKLARFLDGAWHFYSARYALNVADGLWYVRSASSWAPLAGGGGGEANTASNLGAGSGLFSAKVGVDLRFKSLVAGTNVTLSSDANTVTINASSGGGGAGTVTSVGLSAPTGFDVSGSPVTASGTLALAFSAGYSLPTTANQGNWTTAFGWGNHASAGYEKQLVAGTGIAIDRSIPSAPVISVTGGGGGMTNPMTTAGDLIKGGASGTPERLGIGTAGQFLSVTAGGLAWVNFPFVSINYLVVGGGGSGGSTGVSNYGGGGGGGGGALSGSAVLSAGTALAVTVGSGGAVSSAGAAGNAGGSSTFNGLAANGGGGGSGSTGAAGSGASGGGGSFTAQTGAAGTGGQGFAGGNASGTTGAAGGGGGGSAVGGNAASTVAGSGGAGVLSSISGSSIRYGGGGGGGGGYLGTTSSGAGGDGGGGAGGGTAGSSANGVSGGAGTANRGGGGGGQNGGAGAGSGTSGAGGSGVVIVRYPGSPRATGGTITESGGYTIHTFTASGTFEVL